jgi:hypothetical protein
MQKLADVHETETKPAPVLTCLPADHSGPDTPGDVAVGVDCFAPGAEWVDGSWVDGAWVGGVWVEGAWVDGAWVDGAWVDGAWAGDVAGSAPGAELWLNCPDA